MTDTRSDSSVERIPVVLAWSGGKDSSLALEALRNDSQYVPVALLTIVTREYGRISMHGVRRTLLHAQAVALGLPLVEATDPGEGDKRGVRGGNAARARRDSQ